MTATAAAVLHANGVPVFADVEEDLLARDLDEFVEDLLSHRFLWLSTRQQAAAVVDTAESGN